MTLLFFGFIFLFGTIVGSFLNVVIFRFNTGRTFTKGRSICMNCNRNLRWYELVPVMSFLVQAGKCRRCASKISHQYPIVEFITGLVFVLVAYKFLPILFFSFGAFLLLTILFVFLFSLLIVISVYDLHHKIIPDKLVIIFTLGSLLSLVVNSFFSGSFFEISIFLSLISGPLFALPFVLIWFFSKGRLMGLGDGKLVLGLGWMLGFSQGIFAIMLSFWIGSIVGLFLMILSKNKIGMKTEIPFAPFLIISTFITFFFGLDFLSIIRFFSI